jgi:hypothetical protein
LLSEVRYGALLAYSPRGQSEISKRSRDVCYKIKSGDQETLALVGQRLQEHVSRPDVLSSLFGPEVTLVPMPRSAPLVAGALWPAQKICEVIVGRGLAVQVVPVLERVAAVPKSARAAPGERPTIDKHYDSFTAHARVDVTDRILLVDDVVTKGATAIAAASRLHEIYPAADIKLLAAIRTKGLVLEIDRILDPIFGVVRLVDHEPQREP